MKPLSFLLFLSVLASCRSSKLLEAPAVPVTIEGDSLFFDGAEREVLAYGALSDILFLSAELRPHEKQSIALRHPSVVGTDATWHTVFPGDNISITRATDGAPSFTIKDNEKRNRELHFEAALNRLHYKLQPRYPIRDRLYPLDSVLRFEQKMKAAMPGYISRSFVLLDSLASVYQIEDDFKAQARIALENRQKSILYGLYFTYQQELKDANLYIQKQGELLPLANSMSSKQHIYLGGSTIINWIMSELLTIEGNRIKTEQQLKEALDTVKSSLTRLSRAYYLTKVMYHALYRDVPVSKKTMRYYYRSCKDAAYESIVRNLIAQKKKYAAQAKHKKDNRLIAFSDAKVYTLEEVLEQQKGKLVLIDVWASWCVPCLEQHPYMEKLKQRLKGENITFLYLSTDRELNSWRRRSTHLNLDSNYSFVFEGREKQSFLKKYNIETIPRYLLLDERGNMINADAPGPDSGELERLIRLHLAKRG